MKRLLMLGAMAALCSNLVGCGDVQSETLVECDWFKETGVRNWTFVVKNGEVFYKATTKDGAALAKLEDCTIIDADNWKCGDRYVDGYVLDGVYMKSYRTTKYVLTNNTFAMNSNVGDDSKDQKCRARKL